MSAHSLYDAGDVSSAADDEDDEDVFYNLDRKLHCLIVYLSLHPPLPLSLPPPLSRKLAGCPSLLDPDDLVRMKEPDWKCVYTYIQEFYRSLVEKGLVKTKKRS